VNDAVTATILRQAGLYPLLLRLFCAIAVLKQAVMCRTEVSPLPPARQFDERTAVAVDVAAEATFGVSEAALVIPAAVPDCMEHHFGRLSAEIAPLHY
jgi:hypothetical protein